MKLKAMLLNLFSLTYESVVLQGLVMSRLGVEPERTIPFGLVPPSSSCVAFRYLKLRNKDAIQLLRNRREFGAPYEGLCSFQTHTTFPSYILLSIWVPIMLLLNISLITLIQRSEPAGDHGKLFVGSWHTG